MLMLTTAQQPHFKKSYVLSLLEQLENKDAEIRFESARRILYIAHGTPIYTTSPEDHLSCVLTNCTLLRDCNALQVVFDALRSTGGRWTIVSSVPDDVGSQYHGQGWPTMHERQEYLDEINLELGIYVGILYFMVEIFRGDDDWAEELSAFHYFAHCTTLIRSQ